MNISDVADELFEMQDQISDGAYLTIMNLLKEKHNREPKKPRHPAGCDGWVELVGNVCCCNIIYYEKCNKDMLRRIVPFLERLKNDGNRFSLPKVFGPGKMIGKDAATAIVSVIEHLRKLYSRGRERHIIDTSKFIFMIEFPILLDTDSDVRDATYKQICDRAIPAWPLWKSKFEERYGAALIKDN
jgi:hypothetical protein